MFEHQDRFEPLNHKLSLHEKIVCLHADIRRSHPQVDRVAVAVYDPQTDVLETLAFSSDGETALQGYRAKLSSAPSLRNIVTMGRPRIVPDMDLFRNGRAEHTKTIAAEHYRASYTVPMFHDDVFFGFVFFNSRRRDSLDGALLERLDASGRIISLSVLCENPELLQSIRDS